MLEFSTSAVMSVCLSNCYSKKSSQTIVVKSHNWNSKKIQKKWI